MSLCLWYGRLRSRNTPKLFDQSSEDCPHGLGTRSTGEMRPIRNGSAAKYEGILRSTTATTVRSHRISLIKRNFPLPGCRVKGTRLKVRERVDDSRATVLFTLHFQFKHQSLVVVGQVKARMQRSPRKVIKKTYIPLWKGTTNLADGGARRNLPVNNRIVQRKRSSIE